MVHMGQFRAMFSLFCHLFSLPPRRTGRVIRRFPGQSSLDPRMPQISRKTPSEMLPTNSGSHPPKIPVVLGLDFLRFADVSFVARHAKLEKTSSSSRPGPRRRQCSNFCERRSCVRAGCNALKLPAFRRNPHHLATVSFKERSC